MLHRASAAFTAAAALALFLHPALAAAHDEKPIDPDDTPPNLAQKPSPPSVSERTTSQAFDVFGSMQFIGPNTGSAHSSAIAASGLQLALGYRISRGFSVDALLSSWKAGEGKFVRTAAEARGHFLRSSTVDLWTGGELGLGITSQAVYDCAGDCNGSSSQSMPIFGLGTGIDLLADYVSVGFEARALVASSEGETAPWYVFGLTLGLHLPTQ